MITALRKSVTVKEGGVISVRAPRLKSGTKAEVIVLVEGGAKARTLTAGDLLASDLLGVWAHRKDVGDSLKFARSLRRRPEHRGRA